jgi:hypothetical protein
LCCIFYSSYDFNVEVANFFKQFFTTTPDRIVLTAIEIV